MPSLAVLGGWYSFIIAANVAQISIIFCHSVAREHVGWEQKSQKHKAPLVLFCFWKQIKSGTDQILLAEVNKPKKEFS